MTATAIPAQPAGPLLLRLTSEEYNTQPDEVRQQLEEWARGNGVDVGSDTIGVMCMWVNYRRDGSRRMYVKTVTKVDPFEMKLTERPMPTPLPTDLAERFTQVPGLQDTFLEDHDEHQLRSRLARAVRAACPDPDLAHLGDHCDFRAAGNIILGEGAVDAYRLLQQAGGSTVRYRALLIKHGLLPPECCDLHNIHCEPPADLCCDDCTEVRHPQHPPGVPCVLEVPPAVDRWMPPAARGLPAAALESAVQGAGALSAAANTRDGRNLLAHALAQLRRDGWLNTRRPGPEENHE
jgi:hypothetical protein